MLPVLQSITAGEVVGVLVFSLVPILVLALIIYRLAQIAEYNRQMVQSLGRIDARLERLEARERADERE